MNDSKDIKRLLLPLLKNWYILAVAVICAGYFGKRMANYTNSVYETELRMKMDDGDVGLGQTNLYKTLDYFTTNQDILSEVEVLKSPLILGKVVKKLDWDVSYYRVGKMMTSEMYHNSPIFVDHTLFPENLKNKKLYVNIVDHSSYQLLNSAEEATMSAQGKFGQPVEWMGQNFTINLVDSISSQLADGDLLAMYAFEVHTHDALIHNIILPNLFVKEVDKDMLIVRIIFESEIAEKTAQLCNTLAETYILDHVMTRTGAADETVGFLKERLDEVTENLRETEAALEEYRIANHIINTKQETEMGLRKIGQLEVQLVTLNMDERALDSLEVYISTKDIYEEFAPSFENIGGNLYAQMVKKIKDLKGEKREKLLKYTPRHEEIQVIDKKILDNLTYIKESIHNHKLDLATKKAEVKLAIKREEEAFQALPALERNYTMLERDFLLNQNMYKFLAQRKMEADLAASAKLSFHRIIQPGMIPEKPTSPKKTFIVVLYVFLAIILSVGFIYVRHALRATINTRDQIERATTLPLIGVVRKMRRLETRKQEVANMLSAYQLKVGLPQHAVLCVTSSVRKEGKSTIAGLSARVFAQQGRSVAIINFNQHAGRANYDLGEHVAFDLREAIVDPTPMKALVQGNSHDKLYLFRSTGFNAENNDLLYHAKLDEFLANCRSMFDFIILDAPATAFTVDAVHLMKKSDQTLFVFRAGHTRVKYLQQPDSVMEEFGLQNVSIVLNAAHRATNYSGRYAGSRYSYRFETGIPGQIRHYLKHYFA